MEADDVSLAQLKYAAINETERRSRFSSEFSIINVSILVSKPREIVRSESSVIVYKHFGTFLQKRFGCSLCGLTLTLKLIRCDGHYIYSILMRICLFESPKSFIRATLITGGYAACLSINNHKSLSNHLYIQQAL